MLGLRRPTPIDGVLPTQTVTGTGKVLSGTVTETGTGDPLAGVHVVVLRAADFAMARGAVTDNTGDWSVDVAAGDYHVAFVDSTATHHVEWFDDQPSTGLADAAVVTAPATADAALDPSTGSLAGTITDDSTGDPLDAAWVLAIGPQGITGGVATGPDGTYRIDGLTPGTYSLAFVDPNGGRTQEYWDGATTPGGANPLAVTAAATTTADATLALP